MALDADWALNRNGYLEIAWRFHPGTLEFMEGAGETVTFAPGTRILSENEDGGAMFLVLEGTARVSRTTPEGDRVLAMLDPFRSFGEVAMLLANSKRSASVYAETEMRALKITRDDLMRLSVENPQIALHIYRILAESLARALQQTGTAPAQFQ